MRLKKVVLGDLSQSSQPTLNGQLNLILNQIVFLGGKKKGVLIMGDRVKELEIDLVRRPVPYVP